LQQNHDIQNVSLNMTLLHIFRFALCGPLLCEI
jgi:hypothetical protein